MGEQTPIEGVRLFAWFRWDSLSTKIIVWSFVPAAIILLMVALATLNAYQEVTEDLVIERDRELTHLAASKFVSEISQYSNLLLDETRRAGIYNAHPSDQAAALIEAKNRLLTFDGGVVILDSFGQVSATLPLRESLHGEDWSAREYFILLLRTRGDYAFSNIVADGPGDTEVISIATAIYDPQGEFRGAMVGMFQLDPASNNAFHGTLVSLRLGMSGQMYLFDGRGHIIFHSDPTQIGKDFSGLMVVQRTLKGEGGALRTVNAQGQSIVAGFAPVPLTDWGLVTEDSWSVLTREGQNHAMFLLLLLVAGVIIPTLVVLVGIRRIMKPIEALMDATQAVARGDFGKTLPVSSKDEIGKLTEQFNLMSSELESSYTLLERRVGDRTRELSALYEVTSVANESLDLEVTLERSFNQVLEALEAKLGSIQLLDDHGDLHIAIQRNIPTGSEKTTEQVKRDHDLSEWVVNHNEPLVVQDLSNEMTEENETLPHYAYVGVPVRLKKKMLGVLSVIRSIKKQFTTEEVALLGSIADQIGVAIENARLYEQAEQMAVIEERSRLARDLHDSVTQSLYSVILFAEAAKRLSDKGKLDETKDYLIDLKENAQQALKELRLMVYELRSPTLENEGLIGALQHRLNTVEERAGVKTELQVEGTIDLEESVEEALYRIVQEALNNSLKHAAASAVEIKLSQSSGHFELCVSDNGQGFDPDLAVDSGGIGMFSMRERIEKLGGSFEVISNPDSGTSIQCHLKLM